MKRMIKLLLLGCCLFLCLPASAGASGSLAGGGVTEIPGQTSRTELSVSAKSPDSLAGGVVTEIPRQMFMTNLPTTEFEAGSDPAQLDELTSLLDNYTIIVTCGGETYELPMELSWNRDAVNFRAPGSYKLIGTILVPDGCTFADGVLRQLVMPIRIVEPLPDEKRTLTMLHNAGPILVGNMLYTGSYESLKQSEELWKGLIQSAGACNDYGDSAPLELDHFDDSRVLLDTPGEYTVDVFLRLPREYDNVYTLDPAISVLHIPIRVSDPESFDLWLSHTTSYYFILRFVPRASRTIRIFCTQSPSPLTWEELKSASWSLYDTVDGGSGCYSVSRPLPRDTYFYFYFEDGTDRSNGLCILDDGKAGIIYPFVVGRDGGDAIGPTVTPPISKPPVGSGGEPAPDEPSTEPVSGPAETEAKKPSDAAPVLAANPAVKASPDGTLSDMTADITGKVLLKMIDKGGGTIRVSNDGITVTLKQEVFSSYSIREDSEIRVTVSFVGDNQFVLKLSVDGTDVQEVAGTKIMVPYELRDEGAALCLAGPDQVEIPADAYDSGLHVVSFTIGRCGTYTIMEKRAAVAASDGGTGGTAGEGSAGTSNGASAGGSAGTSNGASAEGASGTSNGASDGTSAGGASGTSNGASDGTSAGRSSGTSNGASDGAFAGGSSEASDGLSPGENASSGGDTAHTLSPEKPFSTMIWEIISAGVILAALVVFFFRKRMRR